MSESPSRRFAIPQHRIIDAAPIAAIVILLSVPSFVSAAIPIALLHAWVWLRHPRSRSRYVVAAAVLLGYASLTIGPALVIAAIDNDFELWLSRNNRDMLYFFAAAVAAPGIVPILYRLLSRNTLTFAGETETREKHDSSGSIADILFLSIFCAVLFFLLGRIEFRYLSLEIERHPEPYSAILFGFSTSIAGVLSMRILSRVRGVAGIVNFVSAWLLSVLIILLSFELLQFFAWTREDLGYTYLSRRQGIVNEIPHALIAAIWIPIFALVMRGCGIVLLQSDQRLGNDKPAGKVTRVVGIAKIGVARLLVVGTLGILCFKSAATQGQRAAGWPFTFRFQLPKTPTAPAPPSGWAASWETIEFSPTLLTVDVFAWLLLCAALITPKFVVGSASKRNRVLLRCLILGGLAAWMVHTCVLRQLYYKELEYRLAGVLESRGSIHDIDSPIPVVWDAIADQFHSIPEIDRYRVRAFVLRDADQQQTAFALSLPKLSEISLRNCQVTAAAIGQLRGSPYLTKLDLNNCQIDAPVWEIAASLPRLTELSIIGYVVVNKELRRLSQSPLLERLYVDVDSDGELTVPDSVREMGIRIPNNESQQILIRGAPKLASLDVSNSLRSVAETVTQLSIENVPSLIKLGLDNRQKFDLSIRNAPVLMRIHDFYETRMHYQGDLITGDRYKPQNIARLTRLTLSGVPALRWLHADLSDCEKFDLVKNRDFVANKMMMELLLNGRKHDRVHDAARMSGDKAATFLGQFPDRFILSRLEIHGVNVNKRLVSTIADVFRLRGLVLRDCRIDDDAFADVDEMRNLERLTAETFAPKDSQLVDMLGKLPLLRSINIDGSKLTEIPSSLAPQSGIVRLGNAHNLKHISRETIRNVILLSTHGAEQGKHVIGDRSQSGMQIRVHGPAINDAFMQELSQRIAANQAGNICIVEPSASQISLQGFDWGLISSLSFVSDDIDNDTIASWKMPEIDLVHLSGAKVTPELLDRLPRIGNGLGTVRLSGNGQRANLPELKNCPNKFIILAGYRITQSDVDRIFRSNLEVIDLSDCDVSDALKQKIIERSGSSGVHVPLEPISEVPGGIF